jgi:ABC-type dipeptide/oligopeptide/nickel transport system permease subunit
MSVADERITVGALAGAGQRFPERGMLESVWRFFRLQPRIPIFGGIMLLIFVVTLAAPLLAPYGEREVNTRERLQSPSVDHWFGTDQLGRDLFSRVLYGGRVALPLGLMAVAIGSVSGIVMGVLAGYFGGWLDQALGRLVDAQIAFPELILILALVNTFGQSLFVVMLAVGVTAYPGYFRLARGQVLQAREFEFVNAARSIGASESRIMLRHVFPNITNPLIIQTSIACGGAVLLQSTLGFFGLGPKAGTADWGSMFFDGLNNFRLQPWLVVGPGIAVFISVLSFYMIGDALRDALDPHLRGKKVKV